jgi:integrase
MVGQEFDDLTDDPKVPRPGGTQQGVGVRRVVAETSPRDARLAIDERQLMLDLGLSAPSESTTPAAPPEPQLPTIGEHALAWLEHVKPVRVDPDGETRLVRHLQGLFLETEETITGLSVELYLRRLLYTGGMGAGYVNKVQATGRRIVAHAQKRGIWRLPNPFALAKRLKEKRRRYELLTLAELAAVQAHLPAHRVSLFRLALHTGMRPGELFALRAEDVDLDRGTIAIHRSHGRDKTKTGEERVAPIVPAIEHDLRAALEAATEPDALVFPNADGDRQRFDTKLTRILRSAMAAAHVGVLGAWYRCRLPRRCSWSAYKAGPIKSTLCPRCGWEALYKAKVRPVRWYDLRHMAATFHHQHEADGVCIALALGHALRGTTDAVYTHPSAEKMRRELSRWSLKRAEEKR